MPGTVIHHLTVGEVDRLEPLWRGLHDHNRAIAPELEPYADDTQSWTVRRGLYHHVLSQGGVAAVAVAGGADVGYLVAGQTEMPWTATLQAPDRVAELVTLFVRPEAHDRGIGPALLDVFDAELRAAGEPAALVGVLPQDQPAVALLQSRGFAPAWLTMTRFARPREHPPVEFQVEPVAADEIDALRPLWLELHHHHQRIAPQMAPFLSDDASWAAMREVMLDDARDHLAFRIGPAEAPVAMMTGSADRDSAIWDDIWSTEMKVAEPDVLVVADGARGGGLGSALMDTYDDHLRARGITDQLLAAAATNHNPIRLYERRGFRPAWLELQRL